MTAPAALPPVDHGFDSGGAVPVPLARLYVDARNPRADVLDDGIDELAANIAAFGLLTPLIAVDGALGAGVIDGRRRLLALNRLVQQGTVHADDAVPVLLRQDDEAEGLALAANTARVALSAAQEARAFAKMLDAKFVGGHASETDVDRAAMVAGIARAFGVTVRHVEQRLKLAALHPPILAALDAGEIDLDTARTWARADAALQASVWEKLGPKAQKFAINQALDKKAMTASGPIARFVGEAAYVAAGGRVERDLFGDEDDALWLDRKIAEKLATQKLDDEKARLEAEGWSFVETRRSPPSYMVRTATVKARKPTPEEQAVIDGLKADAAAEEAAQKAAVKALADDVEFKDRLAVEKPFDERINALGAKLEAATGALQVFDPKLKATHGAIAFIDAEGALGVKRAVKPPEKTKADDGAQAGGVTRGPANYAARQEERGVSHAGEVEIERVADALLARALAASPHACLAAVVANFARSAFETRGASLLDLHILQPGGADPLGKDADRDTAQHAWKDALKACLKKPGAPGLEAELLTWAPDALVKLLAFCAAPLAQVDSDAPAVSAAFARHLAIDPGLTWTPPLALLQEFSEKALRAGLAECGVVAAANAKPAQLAAQLADVAARVKWTPPQLRTLLGATFDPIPISPGVHAVDGAAAPKKRGRPSNAEKAARGDPPKAPGASWRPPAKNGDTVTVTVSVNKPAPKPKPKKAVARKTPAKKPTQKKPATKGVL